MSGFVNHTSSFDEPVFGHAWRDSQGEARASVDFGPSWITFHSADQARAAAAACNQAADAMDALPPAEAATPPEPGRQAFVPGFVPGAPVDEPPAETAAP